MHISPFTQRLQRQRLRMEKAARAMAKTHAGERRTYDRRNRELQAARVSYWFLRTQTTEGELHLDEGASGNLGDRFETICTNWLSESDANQEHPPLVDTLRDYMSSAGTLTVPYSRPLEIQRMIQEMTRFWQVFANRRATLMREDEEIAEAFAGGPVSRSVERKRRTILEDRAENIATLTRKEDTVQRIVLLLLEIYKVDCPPTDPLLQWDGRLRS